MTDGNCGCCGQTRSGNGGCCGKSDCCSLLCTAKYALVFVNVLFIVSTVPNIYPSFHSYVTLWCQLEDMFQLIVTPQGIEKVTIQLIDTPTKVYAIGARLFLSKVPIEVLQNWVLIQFIVTPHILGKV